MAIALGHIMVLRLLCLALLSAACGGPHLKSKPVHAKTFEATQRCSQGPLETRFVAQGAKWGESIEIRACGVHGIRARASVRVDGKPWAHRSIGFGEGPWENERCVMRGQEATVAKKFSKTRASSSGSSTSGPSGSRTTSEAPTNRPSMFRDTNFAGEVCPNASTTVLYLDTVREGAPIDVRIWSEEPNDFERALVQIRHLVHWPSVSEKDWKKHLAKEERRARKREEAYNREAPSEAELRQRIASAEVYRGPTKAPPPSRVEIKTPRLSVNAEWVPGYWHWHDADWVWIAGNWRVPSSDIRLGRTLRAAFAPPALRAETAPGQRGGAMLWTPGYWSWDGNAYIWIAGVWRLRPSASAVWTPSRWRVAAGGAIFIPGGWRQR